MNVKHSNTETGGGRWLRVSLLALAALAPIINSISNYLRRQSRFTRQLSEIEENKQSEVIVKSTQPPIQAAALQRLDELTLVTRKRTAEQAQQLQKLAQHWQEQANQLRKAMKNESRQRRELNKTVKQLRETDRDWSQDLRARDEGASVNVAAQSGKITHSLLERGSKVTRDLTQRGSKVTRDLTERGSKVTRDLTERGSKATHALVERGDQLRRSSTFWTIFGFSLGMLAAATITIVLLRKRMITQRAGSEEASHIELPQDRKWNGASSKEQGKAAGEIRHLGKEGSSVATLQSVGVDIAQAVDAPADAAFVGVASTRLYYPIETSLEENVKDLVYFVSEDEAKAQGYSIGSTGSAAE